MSPIHAYMQTSYAIYILEYRHDSDVTSVNGYSASMDSIERFETDQDSLSFTDPLIDNIMDAIKDHCPHGIKKLKTKIIVMLNSEAQYHDIPHRYIEKLSKCKYSSTDDIFKYFSCYIKRKNPVVLRIIVDASGCKKAKDLYDSFLDEKTS